MLTCIKELRSFLGLTGYYRKFVERFAEIAVPLFDLYGSEFVCRVDHHSLIWLHNLKNPQGTLARWLEVLGSYKFDVIHRPGRQHSNADALSRLPSASQQPLSEEPEDECGFTVRSVDFSVGLSTDELVLAQAEDPHLMPIIQSLCGAYPTRVG